MRKYLKATYRRAMRLFFAEGEAYTEAERELDSAEEHNNSIYTDIISGIISGIYSYAIVRRDSEAFTLTKSLYKSDAVQLTFFRNEEATGHREIMTAEDIRNDIPDGRYINIAIA